MDDYKQKYTYWKQHATDEEVVKSLAAINSDEQLQEAFGSDLSFGTAGLRGIMGAGTNRMNVYTVCRATQGVASYMRSLGKTSCAITYDSRNNSQKFSQMAAAVLAENGIKVYITRECMPTPYLSYMVRSYGADMGINVTASHNASQYNGYKVYDENGCQLTDDAANALTKFIEGVDPFAKPLPSFDESHPLVNYSDDETEEKYKQCVIAQSLDDADGISVVYSPLNGAGHRVVPEVLARVGVKNLVVVPQQSMPDGNFPTCPYPNPEKKEALELALRLGEQTNADIVVANDPDCDRMGAAVRTDGGYRQLTGNEVGVLLCDYVLSRMQQKGILPRRPVVVKTIVTTPMVDAVCKPYDAEVTDVLTGFKYIGNAIKKLEDKGQADRYVFGFEESCGYLKGTYVRDKDGVVASMLLCQCAAYHKKQGKTLADRLAELEEQLGTFLQQTVSYAFGGVDGAQRKEQLFVQLRQQPFTEIADSKVKDVCDFLLQTRYDLPKSNVLRYDLEDGSRLILRPSGTEPIVKAYIFVRGSRTQAQQRLAQIKAFADGVIK